MTFIQKSIVLFTVPLLIITSAIGTFASLHSVSSSLLFELETAKEELKRAYENLSSKNAQVIGNGINISDWADISRIVKNDLPTKEEILKNYSSILEGIQKWSVDLELKEEVFTSLIDDCKEGQKNLVALTEYLDSFKKYNYPFSINDKENIKSTYVDPFITRFKNKDPLRELIVSLQRHAEGGKLHYQTLMEEAHSHGASDLAAKRKQKYTYLHNFTDRFNKLLEEGSSPFFLSSVGNLFKEYASFFQHLEAHQNQLKSEEENNTHSSSGQGDTTDNLGGGSSRMSDYLFSPWAALIPAVGAALLYSEHRMRQEKSLVSMLKRAILKLRDTVRSSFTSSERKEGERGDKKPAKGILKKNVQISSEPTQSVKKKKVRFIMSPEEE